MQTPKRIKPKVPIDRQWHMPGKETFKMKPIKELLNRYVPKNNDNSWVNPFSGKSILCEHNNDINPDINPNGMDAAVYVKKLGKKKFPGFLFDPPFSLNQATTLYNQFHKEKGKGLFCVKPSSMVYWSKIKNDIADRIEIGGICISFGWNSMGLGLNRGFEQVEILLVPHGGSRNDTIVVVERKIGKRIIKKKKK